MLVNSATFKVLLVIKFIAIARSEVFSAVEELEKLVGDEELILHDLEKLSTKLEDEYLTRLKLETVSKNSFYHKTYFVEKLNVGRKNTHWLKKMFNDTYPIL